MGWSTYPGCRVSGVGCRVSGVGLGLGLGLGLLNVPRVSAAMACKLAMYSPVACNAAFTRALTAPVPTTTENGRALT